MWHCEPLCITSLPIEISGWPETGRFQGMLPMNKVVMPEPLCKPRANVYPQAGSEIHAQCSLIQQHKL